MRYQVSHTPNTKSTAPPQQGEHEAPEHVQWVPQLRRATAIPTPTLFPTFQPHHACCAFSRGMGPLEVPLEKAPSSMLEGAATQQQLTSLSSWLSRLWASANSCTHTAEEAQATLSKAGGA